jgi:hypothetical protein
MSKFTDLQESPFSKIMLTERKSVKKTAAFEKDYELERQYLEKLKTQRMKA